MDHEIRKKGIGGSEVAAILGLDNFSSPYKVWLAKTGRESFSADNKYTQAGLILESAVSDFFELRTNYRIIKASANQQTFTHPKYEFAVGTPDRQYVIPRKVGRGVLECKTTQYAYDEIPEKWFIQLQWYLGILGSKFGSVAWLERGLDFKYKEYEFDNSFFEFLVSSVSQFWNENILKDIPPEPINVEDINLIYKRHSEGKTLEATPEIIAVHSELSAVKDAIKELETKEKELTDAVKMVMRDAESVVVSDKPLFTWRSAKDSVTFDKELFKTDYPDLYSQYLKPVEGSRRFLIK